MKKLARLFAIYSLVFTIAAITNSIASFTAAAQDFGHNYENENADPRPSPAAEFEKIRVTSLDIPASWKDDDQSLVILMEMLLRLEFETRSSDPHRDWIIIVMVHGDDPHKDWIILY